MEELRGKTEEYVHLDEKISESKISVSPVVKYIGEGRALLKTPSELITDFDDELKILVDRMAATLYFYGAVGISAIQLATPKQVFLIRASHDKYATVVNPQILEYSEDKVTETEGCLSFPDIYVSVLRSKEIKVKYQDIKGKETITDLGGLHSRIFQHENDHLFSKTFLDYLTPLKRDLVLTKMNKLERTDKLNRDTRILNAMSVAVDKENV